MWRAMIVDDEPVIRFGIKASVNWAQEDIVVAADCANGAEALQRLAADPVDILITDIKMPLMDGLTLTRKALELNPAMKVILVSSHNDFEYVREGLKLGVADYILKHTLEPEELLAIVRKCRGMLEKDRHDRSRLLGMDHDELTQRRRRYESELKVHLIQSGEPLAEGGYPAWLDEKYAALCIRLNRVYAIEEQYGYLYKSVLLDQLSEALYDEVPEGIAAQTADNELLFLAPIMSENGEQAELLRGGLKELLEEDGGASVNIGYAEGSQGSEVRDVFALGQLACDRSFFEGSGVYRHTHDAVPHRDGKHLPSIIRADGNASASASVERIAELLAEWRNDWAQGGCPPVALKEQASRVLSMLFKHNVDPYALVESFDRLFKTETLAELCETTKQCHSELNKARLESFDAGAAHHPIDKALDYIRAHYLESLTLQQVADYVHVSKNYFSILFKKMTGQNFIDYVITLRFQKAKELLASTELKVYEVAEKSGFNDVKYFGKLFKKLSGHSPIDYRELAQPAADGASGRQGGESQ